MRCESCPVDPVLDCASVRHARFCILAATRPEYLPVIVRASGGRMEPPKEPSRPSSPSTDAGYWDTVKKIEGCRARVSSCGCLGKPATCIAMGDPVEVDYDRCAACVRSGFKAGEFHES